MEGAVRHEVAGPDAVGPPGIRAPFTRNVGQGNGDEVEEEARGHDVAPGPTRAVTRIRAADAVSDTLQYVRGWW